MLLAVLAASLTTSSASAQPSTPGHNGTLQAQEGGAGGWNFYGAVYGWLAGVNGTVALGPVSDIPVDVPFGDIIDNVDIGLSLHLEVQQARGWTFLGDVFFVDLDFGAEEPVSQTPLTIDQKQTIVEGAVGYHVARNWEILGAVRYNDLSVNASTPTDSTDRRSASWFDAFGGVRFTTTLSDRWVFSARADAGAGGSSFAWFIGAGVFYRLSDLVTLTSGYRALSVDYEEGSGTDLVRWDMLTHGLFLGIAFSP
ncbi:MAG: hypothetical protein ACYSUF_01740 [Planctomycetota bacterium]